MARFYTSRLAFVVLLLSWLLLRLPVALNRDASMDWEVVNAKKLLEYGFFERGGATLPNQMMTGRLPYPEDENLVDHPYPTIWLFLPAYAIGGAAGCVALVLAARLAALWFTYKILLRYFSPRASWWATLLFVLAPVMIGHDADPNAVATAAIIWPFAAYQACKVGETGKGAWLLGLTVFFGPQLGWMAHLMAPSLIALAWPASNPGIRQIKQWLFSPGILAIVIATLIAVALFVAQIVLYSSNVIGSLTYAGTQMGQNAEWSRSHLFLMNLVRVGLFVGPALIASAALGLWRSRRRETRSRLINGAIAYLPGFALFLFVLVRFCFIERSPYYFLVFPATVLSAAALEGAYPLLVRLGLLALSGVAAIHVYIGHSLPVYSGAAREITPAFAAHTNANDIVVTNLTRLEPPLGSWDSNVVNATAIAADRVIVPQVRSGEDLKRVEAGFGRNFRRAVYALVSPGPGVDQGLEKTIEGATHVGTATIVIRPDEPNLATRIRETVWKVSGRFTVSNESIAPRDPVEVTIKFYRLK